MVPKIHNEEKDGHFNKWYWGTIATHTKQLKSGRQDGSESQSTCSHIGPLELDPQNPRGRKKELSVSNCPLTFLHARQHIINKIIKRRQIEHSSSTIHRNLLKMVQGLKCKTPSHKTYKTKPKENKIKPNKIQTLEDSRRKRHLACKGNLQIGRKHL